jgi:raffinose/stachyose/melibiose transport system substrate-binding protein
MRTTRRQLMVGGSAAAATLALGGYTPTLAQDKTKITWWHISTIEEQKAEWQALADQYVADHQNVEIEITVLENQAFKDKLTTAMQSGEPPDIFQSWGGGVLLEYAKADLVKDITADLAADGWGESFLPAALGLYGADGKNYGVPWRMGMVVFWYNKALFEQAEIEKNPETWPEFLETVQKIKDAGITPITVGEKDKWPGHFYWVYLATRIGGKAAIDAAYSREGSFTDPTFIDAGARLKELIDLEPFQEGFLGADYNASAATIANGNAAIQLMGHWDISVQKDQSESGEGLGENLDYFLFPSVEGGAGDPTDVLGGGDGFGIGKNASPEAIDFVRFMTSLENQKALAAKDLTVPPVVKGAETAVTDPLLKRIGATVGEANYLQLYYDQFLPPNTGLTVNDAVQTIFAGTATPEEAAQMIEDAAVAEMD